MTNFTTYPHQAALMEFFADRDIESLRVLGLANHGIDLTGIYCLHTGRRVGTFDDFVIQFAIDEESADDDEALVDALVSRCVASMRPTPMLNRPDRITLSNLAEKFPVDILAYLVNRLHSNRWLATHRPSDVLTPYIARIETHKLWTLLAAQGVNLIPWIHYLLELDAKRNLHDLTPPVVATTTTGKWIPVADGESLFSVITMENHAELLTIFESWVSGLVSEYEERDRRATAQANWIRGNSISQPAYVRSWLENPEFATKRAEAAHKAKNKPASTRVKSEKTRKLEAKVSQFLHLLDDIIDGGSKPEIPAEPGPVLRTGASLSFLRKKESN